MNAIDWDFKTTLTFTNKDRFMQLILTIEYKTEQKSVKIA